MATAAKKGGKHVKAPMPAKKGKACSVSIANESSRSQLRVRIEGEASKSFKYKGSNVAAYRDARKHVRAVCAEKGFLVPDDCKA